MRCAVIAATAAAVLLACGAARAEVVVTISKAQQKLAVIVDGNETYTWPVSTGRRGYGTPSGVFHPQRLEPHWYSHKYDNAPMPWSMFFFRGYAVHGTVEVRHLGHAASHGCVRLSPANARTLFTLIRRVGMRHASFVVTDGPLPRLRPVPANVPVAEAAPAALTQPDFAWALARQEANMAADVPARPPSPVEKAKSAEHLSARTHPAARAEAVRPPRRLAEVASDEARVLREREGWLHSLDRKYHFVR
jgi:hypothetical protein